jgi:hypothetical protein
MITFDMGAGGGWSEEEVEANGLPCVTSLANEGV